MRPNFGDSLPPWAASAALAVGVAIVLVPILSYLTKRQAEAATPPEQEGTLGDPVNAKAQANFGPLLFLPDPQPNNPEAIRITNGWDQNNITYIKPPGFNRTIPWNKKCVSQLNDLFSAWSGAGLIPQIIQWNGSWNPRFVRGQRKYLSNHTFATAFDINAQWNPMGVAAAGPGEYGNVQDLAAIATAQGWRWGGNYPAGQQDGMHFERLSC